MAQNDHITNLQQKHIHALMTEMAKQTGQDVVSFRKQMKERFAEEMDYVRPFSLRADVCKQKEYTLFKDFLLHIVMEYGLVYDGILKVVDDPKEWVSLCLKSRTCCITGRKHDRDAGFIVDIHHCKTIGMGRDRDKVDDEGYPKMPLSRIYHVVCHTMGQQSFEDYYHVEGVVTDMYKSEVDVVDNGDVKIETE